MRLFRTIVGLAICSFCLACDADTNGSVFDSGNAGISGAQSTAGSIGSAGSGGASDAGAGGSGVSDAAMIRDADLSDGNSAVNADATLDSSGGASDAGSAGSAGWADSGLDAAMSNDGAAGDASADAAHAADAADAAGDGTTDAGCPHSGNIRYTLNRSASPTSDELDAYDHITTAMDEAIGYYNCYTDLEKQLWVNYDPGVSTAQANIDGWMSFGSNRSYMVLPTAMHEIAHTLGVGYYSFGSMTNRNGIWTGPNANAVLASIPNPRDTQLHADNMHFWPYGLNYASEYENEDDLINHCLIVTAIRKDMGL